MNKKHSQSIATPEDFIAQFIEKSQGLYVFHKNNEHTATLTNTEMKKNLIEDLGNLIDGLSDSISGNDKKVMKLLARDIKKDLNPFVERMDEVLVSLRDQELGDYIDTKDPIKKDQALCDAAKKSIYTAVKENIIEVVGKGVLSSKNDRSYSVWKDLSDLCNKIGLKNCAQFCKKQYIVKNKAKNISKTLRGALGYSSQPASPKALPSLKAITNKIKSSAKKVISR